MPDEDDYSQEMGGDPTQIPLMPEFLDRRAPANSVSR